MEMQYAEARSYCHMLLLCRKGIQKSIDIFRKKQLKQQTEMLQKVYTTFSYFFRNLYSETKKDTDSA